MIKGADKVSSVVVCNRDDYLQESSRKLRDTNIYKDVKFNESVLTGLVEKSSKIFNRLFIRKLISEKKTHLFTCSLKKVTNLGKLDFLAKIHKRLSSVPSRQVISHCGTLTEKVSEYLDLIFKPVMQ